MNNPLNLSRRDDDITLSIARYQRDLDGSYMVELFVETEAGRTHVGNFVCFSEQELYQATEWCDLILGD